MGRIHLFEIEDQPWCPALIRDAGTAYITQIVRVLGMFDALQPHLAKLAAHANGDRFIDLCSGAGGPARLLVEKHGVQVHCTDLFPHTEGLNWAAEQCNGELTWTEEPVDATHVPPDLRGPRTLFNAFHHFRPDVARRILQDAVEAGQPIGIFEFVGRQPHIMLGLLGVPMAVMALLPTCRPFHWAWLPLTYLLPIIPLFVLWDGMVSCLRVYSPAELRELVVGLDAFDWDIGSFPLPGPGTGTYLVGTPRSAGGQP